MWHFEMFYPWDRNKVNYSTEIISYKNSNIWCLKLIILTVVLNGLYFSYLVLGFDLPTTNVDCALHHYLTQNPTYCKFVLYWNKTYLIRIESVQVHYLQQNNTLKSTLNRGGLSLPLDVHENDNKIIRDGYTNRPQTSF